jgi:hypothetical protein
MWQEVARKGEAGTVPGQQIQELLIHGLRKKNDGRMQLQEDPRTNAQLVTATADLTTDWLRL